MDKYEVLRIEGTNGMNYDLATEEIDWDEIYGIELSDIGSDGVTVWFKSLPTNLHCLAEEIY